MHRPSVLLRSLLVTILLVGCALPAVPGGAARFTVILHPDGPLYVGDRVSFEIVAPAGFDSAGQRVTVSLSGQALGQAGFAAYGVGGRQEAVLWWVWNTHGLHPGVYALSFAVTPGGEREGGTVDQVPPSGGDRWTEGVSLLPGSEVPPPEPGAHWAALTTTCCTLYYITGTDAARDIASLGRIADAQSADVSAKLGAALRDRMPVILMPRLLGNGGFTQTAVYVSYLDRNYGDTDVSLLMHHEFVHFYDQSIGGGFRPLLFEEGLAVYLSGGHFLPEALGPYAAAVLDQDEYIPLETLANDFYHQQHEIGYAEAAGLVQYLVATYGWEAFSRFYRSIPDPGGKAIAQAIDAALQANFRITFDRMEAGYKDYLRAQTVTEADRQNLQLTIAFFDAMRRYQQAFDPSAYYLTAWVPDGAEMRTLGVVADYLRHPQGPENRLIEAQLMQAWKELAAHDYPSVTRTLKQVNAALDLVAR